MDTHVWECIELEFISVAHYDNPFQEVELQVEFLGPYGERLLIPGFWDGGALWKVRFAPIAVGKWEWKSICSNRADSGLHGKAGSVMASPWSETDLVGNPNRRGFIRVHPTGRFFEYADGTPFYWLGDTLWAAHTLRCDLEKSLPIYLKDRKDKGFSVIQMVAGHPTGDMQSEACGGYVTNSPGQFLNEGGAPYLHLYDRINPLYFNYLDQRINLMSDMGFVPCIIGMWGQELKEMTVKAAKQYLRYIIARYSAFNVVWSPAGEYLFTWDVQGWRELGEEIDSYDPYKHPTSVHSIAPHSGSRHYHAESWYDFNMIQVGHVLAFKNFMEMLPFTDYQLQPAKPAIMSESWYENHPNRLLDDGKWINDKDIRFAAYVSLLQGCVGQTYGTHGIWSFFNGEESDKWRDDERPDLWSIDLALPGSTQMKYLRLLMETLEWWNLAPHPEWVSTLADSNAYCAAIPRKQYVVYSTGGTSSVPVLVMIMDGEGEGYEGQWFNPRTGEWSKAEGEYQPYGSGWIRRTFTPNQEDWILTLTRKVY
jgi:hypothetical protein